MLRRNSQLAFPQARRFGRCRGFGKETVVIHTVRAEKYPVLRDTMKKKIIPIRRSYGQKRGEPSEHTADHPVFQTRFPSVRKQPVRVSPKQQRHPATEA